ncbi:glyoxalase [Idiomarina tyrosinivorans]|uniref:Glyoxalase n=1 Tax=Idiomarina tyrosinivorans TaxID=1445662 RepID=A0A432ZUB3_9GAMM|nr:VOC family protein [Idiomarina tyrosinivorans]RUO81535.1 glyoxalase [Idiomarina tyrosinivorans]
MDNNGKINYVEWPARELEKTKAFFEQAFDWLFVDYGPDYAAIQGAGLDGGFFRSEQQANSASGSALIVIYSKALEQALENVENAGGVIVKPIFSFPGGRRFHFTCPSGNEYAVWSE